MDTEKEIIEAQSDILLRNDFIEKYMNFILLSAGKATGRYISREDDEYSTALSAFDEALTRYSPGKGNFYAFASMVIRSRIIDEQRKNGKTNAIPFSGLEREDKDGSAIQFDVMGDTDVVTDAQLEIEILKCELSRFDISFFDLTKCSPKFKKTKIEIFKVISFIINNEKALKTVRDDGIIPASLIIENTGANKKLLERHRRYIIASVIILSGDYPVVSEYLSGVKEVCI